MIKCLICGKEISTFGISESHDQTEFLNSGGFVSIEFGYGSGLDGDTYSGYIHDNCLDKSLVKFNGNNLGI